jgi:hypothetical protein
LQIVDIAGAISSANVAIRIILMIEGGSRIVVVVGSTPTTPPLLVIGIMAILFVGNIV